MSNLFRIAAVAAAAGAALASQAKAAGYPEHYAYDPAYNGGAVLDDSFAAAGPHIGQKAAQLADGSIVVVGLATASGQSTANNLGLVHYSATGARIAWSNPTALYASYYNMYLTYPNGQFTAAYSRVDDVKVNGHFIYVLADYVQSSSARYPMIEIFSDTGQWVTGYSPYGYFNGDIEGAGLAVNSYTIDFGGGNVTLSNLAVAASNNTGTAGQPDYIVAMHLYPIDADGSLGSAFTGFGTNGTATFDLSGHCNSASPVCSGLAAGMAAVRTDTNTPTYYVYGTATTSHSSDLPVAFIQAVDVQGEDEGVYSTPMDAAGETAFGLVAVGNPLGDTLYLGMGSASSSEGCLAYGSRVLKIHNGQTQWNETYGCDPQSDLAVIGKSLASDGSRLIVAGYAHYLTIAGSPTYYPGIASIDQANGAVLDVQPLPWLRADGTTWSGTADGHTLDPTSDFESVVPVAAGKFVVAGTLCDHLHGSDGSTNSTCRAFGTAQLVSDTIFTDGFDGG